jgi:hypothetical protein
MASLRTVFASLLLSSSAAVAQTPDFNPLGPEVAVLLDLEAGRARQVNSILHRARERMANARDQIGEPIDAQSYWILVAAMEAIAAEADRQLGEILTGEEMEKWRATLPERARAPLWTRA